MKRKITLLILSIVMGNLTMIAQSVLDLSGINPSLIIKEDTTNFKKKKNNNNNFIISAKDCITINKIVFAKNGEKTKLAEIKEGSKLLLKDSVKNSISKTIIFSPKSILTVTWGNKTWYLNMKENEMYLSNNKKNIPPKEAQGKPNLLYIIIGIIIGGAISVTGLFIFKKYKKTNSTSKSNTQKATAEDKSLPTEVKNEKEDASINQLEPSDVRVKEENEESNGNPQNAINTPKDIKEKENELDCQIETIIKGFEEELFNDCNDRNSKIEKLQEILSIYFNLLDDKKRISKEVGGNENSDTLQILTEIRELKAAKTSSKSKNENRVIAISDIERLIKADEISKSIYNDETNGEFEAKIKQLLEKLCRKIRNSIGTKSVDDRPKVKNYIIELFKPYGLDCYFATNTTLDSGLEKIKEDIVKSKSSMTTNEPDNTDDATTNQSLDFERFVKGLHSQIPEISDNINCLDNLVNVIKDLIKNHHNIANDVSISSEDTEKTTIANVLNLVGMQLTETQEAAIKQIKEAIAKSKELDDICKQYKADNGKELSTAIKEQIYKNIKGQLESKSEIKDIIANCRTAEGIVKELSDAYTDVSLNKQILEKERNNFASNLKEAHTNEGNVEPIDDSDLNAMFNAYRIAVCQKVNTANEKIVTLEKEKEEQKDIIETNNETFNKMRSEMLDVLNEDINDIQKSIAGTFIRPCDISLKSQSDDNQSLLRDSFKKFEKRLQDTITINNHEELYKEVQKIIEEDIVNEYGLTNVLTRYYAYSCLPFMTDQAREYGMRIDHESMMFAYNALNHLTNRFGLQLIVPNLFADRITDGEYKDCTGEKYGDLENMCPGVANYVLEINNSDKQHYITDLVRVGYKENYEVKLKAMVIVAQ